MEKYRKVYFGEKPFILSSFVDQEISELAWQAGVIVINQPSDKDIRMCIEEIEDKDTTAIIILTKAFDHFWEKFSSHFTPVQAGGGLIVNDEGKWLFIHRRGSWDLPKGKLDDGETIEACAIREVQEETGLTAVEIEKHLADTWHVYPLQQKKMLKQTTWFLMRSLGSNDLFAQAEEDITEIDWFKPDAIDDILDAAYPNIRYLAHLVSN